MPNFIVFIICAALLAGALVLTPPHTGTQDVRLGGAFLPSLCTFYNLTGHPCPGCGLVRSVTAAAHGDLTTSLAFHRLGWLVLAYVLVQLFYRGVLVFVPPWRARAEQSGKYIFCGLIVVAAALMLNWIGTFL